MKNLVLCVVIGCFGPFTYLQANTFFSSVKAFGMGGVGVAYPQDALAAAFNPAGITDLGDRFDLGTFWINRGGKARIRNSTIANGRFDNRDFNSFFPEFGLTWTPCCSWANLVFSYGFVFYNKNDNKVKFRDPIPQFGSTPLRVELREEIAAPTIAVRYGSHSLGVAFNFVRQGYKAKGFQKLDVFPLTVSPGHVTNNRLSTSYGFGARIGYLWHFNPSLAFGAAYEPKTHMHRHDKYRGLLVNGTIDIPERFLGGIAFQPMPCMHFVVDAQYIRWSRIRSLSNSPNDTLADLLEHPSGSSRGGGAGWHDQVVINLGADYALFSNFIVRGGYSFQNLPFHKDAVFANIPSCVRTRNTLHAGCTWNPFFGYELSLCYFYSFFKKTNGSTLDISLGEGSATVEGRVHGMGISYGVVF